MTTKEKQHITLDQFMENVFDLIDESNDTRQVALINYQIDGGPFDVDLELDEKIVDYMTKLGWTLVGQGCGFGIRDLEFEGGISSVSEIRRHCFLMSNLFDCENMITGNLTIT